jgi:hypothetical protein
MAPVLKKRLRRSSALQGREGFCGALIPTRLEAIIQKGMSSSALLLKSLGRSRLGARAQEQDDCARQLRTRNRIVQ